MNLRKLQVVFLKRHGADQGTRVTDLSAGHKDLEKWSVHTVLLGNQPNKCKQHTSVCVYTCTAYYEHSFCCKFLLLLIEFFKAINFQNINLISDTAGIWLHAFIIFNKNCNFQATVEEAIVNMQNMLIHFLWDLYSLRTMLSTLRSKKVGVLA